MITYENILQISSVNTGGILVEYAPGNWAEIPPDAGEKLMISEEISEVSKHLPEIPPKMSRSTYLQEILPEISHLEFLFLETFHNCSIG